MAGFSPVEREILIGLLLLGDSLPVDLAEVGDRNPRSVSRSVSNLVDQGLVVNKSGRHVYALTVEGWREAVAIVREEELEI